MILLEDMTFYADTYVHFETPTLHLMKKDQYKQQRNGEQPILNIFFTNYLKEISSGAG